MRVFAFACLISAILANRLAAADDRSPEEHFDSPRLAALAKQLTGDEADNRAAVDKFWEERRGNGPLVEPVAGDPHACWVTFLWRGDNTTQRVNVQGGPASAEGIGWLIALGQTGLWYRTERIPDDARFAYYFQVNRAKTNPRIADPRRPPIPARPDPLNPQTLPSGETSLLELPAAPAQPWLERVPSVPSGELHEHSLHSEFMHQERGFTVYTPPHDTAGDHACPLLVLFDGGYFKTSDMIPAPVILDNLISQKQVPPLVAVLVTQTERNPELGCSEAFADFTAAELVPWVRDHYRVTADPAPHDCLRRESRRLDGRLLWFAP